jgi:hypothetical protein
MATNILSKRPGGDAAKALPKVVRNTISNSCRLNPKLLTSGEPVVPSLQQSSRSLPNAKQQSPRCLQIGS